MSAPRMPRLMIAAAAILVGVSTAAWADPPARVGRLSDVEGTVSFHTADQTDWSPATLNYPVTTGTSFWTEPNAKAEIQIGAAEVRLDQGTWTDVVQLDDNATQIRVNQGAVNIHVHQLPQGGISVLTPQGQVDLIEPGSYDINAGSPPDDNTPPTQMVVTVLEGHARFDGPQSSVDIQDGEAATIGGDPLNIALAEGNPTPFDNWALAREHRETTPASTQYVPPTMTGYQDLDSYGQWASTPDYGQVWYPANVAADWAPYHNGHWAYVQPWGWTWIDDAPWGFAPFHYGRWAYINNRWGWAPVAPGVALAVQPVYAPALVAFIGGDGFGIDLSIGGLTAAVGWVPLAPYEVYRPWYRVNRNYVRNVNAFNMRPGQGFDTRPNRGNTQGYPQATVQRFANRNAAVVVPAQAFTHAAPVQRARVDVPRAQLDGLQVANRQRMSTFKATADARMAVARPNAVAAQQANIRGQVATQHVAYHPEPAAARAEPVRQAPGPRFAGAGVRQNPAVRQNAAVTSAPQRVQPNAARANQPRPAAATPAPRPAVQPNATENRAVPAAAAPAPRPAAPPNAAAPRPEPAAATPAPRPPAQPNAAAPRTAPAAAAPAPHPPVRPNAVEHRPQPAAAAPAPRPPAAAAQPVRPVNQPQRPAAVQAQPQMRPQMQIQHPVQQTHIQATPQGWQRGPAPAAAPRPAAAEPERKETR